MNWRLRAACARPEVESELFFPLPGDNAAREKAIAVCAGCEVSRECSDFARETGQTSGVWAGIDRGVANARRSDRLRLARAAAG
jgi:WhiB family redox-sensing transcriptional regulator